MKGLYIHIPFCNRICTYCDFNKFLIKNQPVDEYLDALINELADIPSEVATIFIGGGTPTALSLAQLERLLSFITSHFTAYDEFTMEANPDELTADKIALMKSFGVNRLSLGVQTFNEELLEKLGRTHHANDVKRAVSAARAAGIKSISIDLMYHLPGQTLVDVKRDLETALQLDIDHISSYSLILEPKTQFYNQYRKGMLQLPDELLAAEMYDYINQTLAETDFKQYEISNYAKAGCESKHNKIYWQNEEYYGAGAGSHGYVDGIRYYNVIPVPHYIKAVQQGSALLEKHPVTLKEAMEEFMFLGLRMNIGISAKEFTMRYGKDINEVFPVLTQLQDQDLIEIKDSRIFLTDAGRMIGNEVFEKFLLD